MAGRPWGKLEDSILRLVAERGLVNPEGPFSDEAVSELLRELVPPGRSAEGVKSHANRLRLDGVVWAPGAPLDADTIQAARELVEQARAARASRKVSPGQQDTLNGSAGAPPPSQLANDALPVPRPPQPKARRFLDSAPFSPGSDELCLIGGDGHRPFHDRGLWRDFVGLAHHLRPTCTILNGDDMDCKSLGRFPKDHRLRFHPDDQDLESLSRIDPLTGGRILDTELQHEINLLAAHMMELEEATPATEDRRWHIGNHCNRLYKDTLAIRPDLADLHQAGKPHERVLDFGYLTGARGRGWEVKDSRSPDDENYSEWHGVKIGHFKKVLAHSAYTARGLLERFHCNVVQAHTHRGGISYKTVWTAGGREIKWGLEGFCMLPCRCGVDH